MTSKERSYLIGLAAAQDSIFQVGKAGITPEVVQAVEEALAARELVKLTLLKNLDEDEEEVARTLADRTRSELVIKIGHKVVLYRENPNKKDGIVLPGHKKKEKTEADGAVKKESKSLHGIRKRRKAAAAARKREIAAVFIAQKRQGDGAPANKKSAAGTAGYKKTGTGAAGYKKTGTGAAGYKKTGAGAAGYKKTGTGAAARKKTGADHK